MQESTKKIKIGIMGAMPEEIHLLKSKFDSIFSEIIAEREYLQGKIDGIETVLVFSRWGKVAAASTVTTLIAKYNITHLIFTGAAGAISSELNIGDIVISSELYQHDMDARPLCKQHEIPLTNIIFFKADQHLIKNAYHSAVNFTKNLHIFFQEKTKLEKFSIQNPKTVIGKIATGDQFINSIDKTLKIQQDIPDTLAVEMEGAAIGQICHEHNIPFVVVRTISDKADHTSHIDFSAFVKEIMAKYSEGIVSEMYKTGFSH